jgi:nucleoside-diphosphate-sugar epimerase
MRILVTGGTGVLGRQAIPRLQADGHDVRAPGRTELDLFDPVAVAAAVDGADAILHLATRIPVDRLDDREAWRDNDRLRSEASRLLVDAALAAGTTTYVQPTVPFLYPPEGPVDEDTPLVEDVPEHLQSVVDAETQTARFAAADRRGVVLRIGLLDGPGTGNDAPLRPYPTVDVRDAGDALVHALELPSGVYNVVRDGERVSNARHRATGWAPQHDGA